MPEVEERVIYLEEMMGKLIQLQFNTQMNLDRLSVDVRRTQLSTENLSKEMKEFKNHTQSTIDNFSKEIQKDNKNLRENLQGLSKKLGTIVEDIVIPNIEYIAEKYFGCKNSMRFMPRTKVKHPVDNNKNREFDLVVIYADKVILCEAKSTPRTEDTCKFLTSIEEFFEYFPECAGKELIPIYASFFIPENILKNLSSSKIYGMGIKEDTMDILNPEIGRDE